MGKTKMGMKKDPNAKPKPLKRRIYSVKSDISKLDKMFSEFIRKRAMQRAGGCERCLSQKSDYKQLQCSHVIGRNNRKVRWDEDNAFGLCAGCHMYLEHHPLEHQQLALDKLGQDKIDLLWARSHVRGKVDIAGLILYYTQKTKELESGD